jgi:hypothetical protein
MAFSDEEIHDSLAEERRLPNTYRRGWPGKRDDVAVDTDGNFTHVSTPETPEDKFSS